MRYAHHAKTERPQPFDWSDAHVDQLKKLVAESKPASQIAQIMGGGLTKNAVIGKCTRLKLQLGGKTLAERMAASASRRAAAELKAAAASRLKAPRVPADPRRKVSIPTGPASYEAAPPATALELAVDYLNSPTRGDAFNPDIAPDGARRVPLDHLRPGECVWPLYEDGPQIFCGCPVKPQPDPHARPFVYCELHAQAAYPRLRAAR